MVKYYALYPDPQALKLLDIYLSFLMHAQNTDGSLRNFMDFDRSWWREEPAHDGLGRTLWGLGTILAAPPAPAYLSVVKDCFDRSVSRALQQSLRGLAYSILGMCDYLRQFPGASDIKRQLETAAGRLVAQYREAGSPDWDWFENTLSYDNPILPHALFAAGLFLDNREYVEVATRTADFLLETTFDGDHFSFIGSHGWYERGKTRAIFDQQPVEAAAMVLMLRAAYDVTRNAKFLSLQRTAFDWFLGTNDLHLPLYDFRTKGCSDGLMAGGINGNQGAESMVSFLVSLAAVIDSVAVLDRIHTQREPVAQRAVWPRDDAPGQLRDGLLVPDAADSADAETPAENEDTAPNQVGEPR
jgi:hypothetical protein